MELEKRSTKGEALTWDEIDGNWLAIENELNKQGRQKLYELANVSLNNSCIGEGLNEVEILGSFRILRSMEEFPLVKGCIVVNNKILTCGISDDAFIGCAFPFVSGVTSAWGSLHTLELQPEDYPVSGAIYMWDEKGNYAEPYVFSIDENPCSYIKVVNCSIGPDLSTYTRVLTITANVKGSGTYTMQYKEGLIWVEIGTVAAENGEVTTSFPIANDFPIVNKQVRIIDSITGISSVEQNTSFAFPDWYAWHLVPVCTCDEGQKFTIWFYIGTMPASNLAIEYESTPGTWDYLHTLSYTSPINLTVMGGGIVDVDVPEGVYNVRLRNLLTGKTLIAEDVAFPNCSTPELNIVIETSSMICNNTTGYLRKLILNNTISTGSGNYKVQINYAGVWNDLHSFSQEYGNFDMDFYIANTVPAATYGIRIVDITTEDNYSNTVEIEMLFADAYTWTSEPEIICDGAEQKIQLSANYANVPESDLIVEVYIGGTWTELATATFSAISASGTQNFDSPFELPETIVGEYNLRLRNNTTGTTLLITDVVFTDCGL